MKSLFRLLFLFVALPGLLLLTGCEEEPEEEPVEAVEWVDDWDDGSGGGGSGGAGGGQVGEDGEVIRDTVYVVVDKRQAGGGLYPDSNDISPLDGRPRMKRKELESMIVVEGNRTGQRSAYLLPQSDYNVVQVGHGLKESTLARWESTTEDHIPAPKSQNGEEKHRSRTGGAAENYNW